MFRHKHLGAVIFCTNWQILKVSGGLININYEIMLLSLSTTNIEIFWNLALKTTFTGAVDYPRLLPKDICAVMFFFIFLFMIVKLVLL